MNNAYKTYIAKYGKFSHILNVVLHESLSENEKTTVLSTIYDMLNDKEVSVNHTDYYSVTNIRIKWRVANETDLLHYYTDGGGGLFADCAILQHTQKVLEDLRKAINKDMFDIIVTKPLTSTICIM